MRNSKYHFKEKCSATDIAVKVTNNNSSLMVKIMAKRKAPNVAESVCRRSEERRVGKEC